MLAERLQHGTPDSYQNRQPIPDGGHGPLGPLIEIEEGNYYVLVVGDHFSKYMAAFALPNQEAKTVTRVLLEEYFCDKAFLSNCTLIRAHMATVQITSDIGNVQTPGQGQHLITQPAMVK